MKPTAREDSWQKKYRELEIFYAIHNTSHIEQRMISEADDEKEMSRLRSLNYWIKHQRRLYKAEKLPPEKIELLDRLDFVWKVTDGKNSFEKRIRELKAYKKKFGTTHVPQIKNEYYKLSRWVNEMRRLYEEERLSVDRINRLNQIGFIWNVEDDNFERNLKKLKAFHREHGHWDVPQTGKTKKLGQWVAQIRSRGLKKERHVHALRAAGFEFRARRYRIQAARDTMLEIDIKRKILSKKAV